jgi:hypothetical protein
LFFSERERKMAENSGVEETAVTREAARMPQEMRQESLLRWPSVATTGGAAYTPSQTVPTGQSDAEQG